jgi:selenium donor protein
VTEVCHFLEKEGFRVTYVGVDEYGMTDPEAIEAAITGETILITVMHSNNEVGTIQPVEEIARIASARKILFHTDAAQSVGKVKVDTRALGVDLLSVAGHKLYAPKGVGALYIRRGVVIEKLIHGADHERNLRAGTENVIEIAGLGMAAEVAEKRLEESGIHTREMRDRLHQALSASIPGLKLNGHPVKRLPNTLSLSFPGADAQAMLSGMKGVAASAGAACHADTVTISGVLTAMNVPVKAALGTIRFSTGRTTTPDEIDLAAREICEVYSRLAAGGNAPVAVESTGAFRLTEYTHSLGCACKIRPQSLEKLLAGLPKPSDAALLVGTETSDDAAIYKIREDLAIVQTVDFIPPVVDDPYAYGAIATANALSDIYAMGGRPLFALSVVGFPEKVLPLQVLQEIMRGATDKVAEAGICIAGGHSIEDSEPKFGLVVTGTCDPGKIWRNRGAQPGDLLVLTKPVGAGILTTAMKRGYATAEAAANAVRIMSALNRAAAETLAASDVHACTDVTGFGLLGHLREMIQGSGTDAAVAYSAVPLMTGVTDYAEAGMVPGGSLANLEFVSSMVDWEQGVGETAKTVLADAQTSGGLLVALPEKDAQRFAAAFPAAIIGRFIPGTGRIRVGA